SRQGLALVKVAKHIGQRGGSEVRHAHGLKWPGVMQRVNWDNVRVLELGQPMRLTADAGRYFQSNQPVGKITLVGQIYPPKRAAAEHRQQPEAEKGAADRWKCCHHLSQSPRGLGIFVVNVPE